MVFHFRMKYNINSHIGFYEVFRFLGFSVCIMPNFNLLDGLLMDSWPNPSNLNKSIVWELYVIVAPFHHQCVIHYMCVQYQILVSLKVYWKIYDFKSDKSFAYEGCLRFRDFATLVLLSGNQQLYRAVIFLQFVTMKLHQGLVLINGMLNVIYIGLSSLRDEFRERHPK